MELPDRQCVRAAGVLKEETDGGRAGCELEDSDS